MDNDTDFDFGDDGCGANEFDLDNFSEEERAELEAIFDDCAPTTTPTKLVKAGRGLPEHTVIDGYDPAEDDYTHDMYEAFKARPVDPQWAKIERLEREQAAQYAEAFDDDQQDIRAPKVRREPTLEELSEWVRFDAATWKFVTVKPIPALTVGDRVRHEIPAGTNPVTVWKPKRPKLCRDGIVREYPKRWGAPVIMMPKLRYVQAYRAMWLFTTGSYPTEPLSPLDGNHRNLDPDNWRPAPEALAFRNAARKELRRRASIAQCKEWMAKHRAEQRARKAPRKAGPAQPAPPAQEPAAQGRNEASKEPVNRPAESTSMARKCFIGR